MALFLLLGLPLGASLLATSTLDQGRTWGGRTVRWVDLCTGWIKGAGCFLPPFVVVSLLGHPTLSYRPAALYFGVFALEHGLYYVFAVVGFLLFYGIPYFRRTKTVFPTFLELVVFFVGFYTAAGIVEYVRELNTVGYYELFIGPVFRACSVCVTAALLVRLAHATGLERVAVVVALILWPFVPSFGGVWYARQYVVLTVLWGVCVPAVVGLYVVKERRELFSG